MNETVIASVITAVVTGLLSYITLGKKQKETEYQKVISYQKDMLDQKDKELQKQSTEMEELRNLIKLTEDQLLMAKSTLGEAQLMIVQLEAEKNKA